MPEDVTTPATMARDAIAAEVRAEMARQSKTLADLGDVLGVSRQSMHLRLRGHQPFRGEELVLIARYLGVPTEQFVRPVPDLGPIQPGLLAVDGGAR